MLFHRFAHSAGPGIVRQRVEWIGSGVDGLMQSSKWQVRSALWEMIAHQLNHSLTRSLTRSLARRGKTGDRGPARPRRQGEERREKRGERRTNTEERGGRREERREKTEDRRAAQSADDPKAEEPKIALSGFHRPAASARCAAIPTWLRRWVASTRAPSKAQCCSATLRCDSFR